MSNLYLLRHTPPLVDPGICYGQLDLEVNEAFSEELERIRTQLDGISFDRTYSSPLIRCAKLAHSLEQEVHFDDRLRELNFGNWEGVSWNAIYETAEGKQWFDNYLTLPCPQGESYLELISRVTQFVQELDREDQNVLIVTHAGVIRAFLVVLGYLELHQSFELPLGYGEIIELNPAGYKRLIR